jgi:hypothetical protein
MTSPSGSEEKTRIRRVESSSAIDEFDSAFSESVHMQEQKTKAPRPSFGSGETTITSPRPLFASDTMAVMETSAATLSTVDAINHTSTISAHPFETLDASVDLPTYAMQNLCTFPETVRISLVD